jgi:hypothetical protein
LNLLQSLNSLSFFLSSFLPFFLSFFLYLFPRADCGFDNECGSFRRVQVYNPSSNAWTQDPMIPWELQGSAQCGIVNGNQIVVSGGLGKNGVSTNKAGIYNPQSKTWTTIPNMPQGL